MLREIIKNRGMIIKVIDWISRIIAVLLVMSNSFSLILLDAMWDPDEFDWWTVKAIIITMSILQVGLFLAPIARKKTLIWRIICGILMLPGSASFFLFFIVNMFIFGEIKFMGYYSIIIGRSIDIINIIGIMVYLIQYWLFFKDIKDSILFKPIYLSKIITDIIKCIRSKILQI